MTATKRLTLETPSWSQAAALWTVLVIAPATITAAAPGAEFRPYPLQYAKAAEIQSAVEAVLPAGSDVVADTRGNRLMVAGSPEAHQIAQNAIRSLDRPKSSAASEATPSQAQKPVMASYPCPQGKAEATAQRLRDAFGRNGDVRIVGDPRTSQVLVLAPPDLQPQIAAQIDRPGAPVEAAPAATPMVRPNPTAPRAWSPNSSLAGPTAADGRRSQVVQLWQISAQSLESFLLDTLGQRIKPAGAAAQGHYVLTVSGGREIQLALDPRTNRATVDGPASAVDACVRLIHALDAPADPGGARTQVVPLSTAPGVHVRRVIEAIQTGESGPAAPRTSANPVRGARGSQVSMQTQPPGEEKPEAEQPKPGEMLPGEAPEPEGPAPEAPRGEAPRAGDRAGMVGPVQVELLEGLDIIVVRGLRRDVEQVMAVIEQIERLSRTTEPVIEVYAMKHVDCEAVAALVQQLYADIFEPRQGVVSVTALVKPNALLVIGQQGNVDKALELVKKVDRPVAPETQFRVFRLKFASAETVQTQVQEFYSQRPGLGVRVLVTSDYRSNSLIIMARPRDMVEVASLVERLDTLGGNEAEHEIRVFKLEHSLADELAPILQSAIVGEGAARAPGAAPAAPAAPGAAPAARRATGGTESKSTTLSFATVDARGQRILKSGILTDARITPDTRANALIVSAPAQNMPLLEALIKQLDQMPTAEAQVKVFTIVNGDAPSMTDMLEALFAARAAGAGGGSQLQPQNVAVQGESSLVPLRFAVDARTNSIIATGTPGFLTVVEAILLRLDESDVRNRKSLVYRLRNAPALDVANAINQFLTNERQVQQVVPGIVSPYEQVQREVVVVPEVVSNSLIVSATPRFYDEIVKVIDDIDKRPPMVMIQVLIGEVTLSDIDEFGVELGLQDSILFDRSILSNIVTTTSTTTFPNGSQTTNQNVTAADIQPGFLFNNQPLGNSGASSATAHANTIGTQGLSNFGLSRINSDLGFGGLVLSASSESVSILVRALKQCQRLDVLSRPQVMTLDNQPAFVQVGQEVPTIRGTTLNETGQVNNIDYANVGLILGVTPRVSPDRLVVMEIDAVKSEVGPEAEGIPISISATGDVIRSPRINTTRAQTTVSALDGQTIVLGGLITKSNSKTHRRVPVLAEIPILGNLFRYDRVDTKRTELLIIMTPRIVTTEQDADAVRLTEAGRMSWCLGDVIKIHGDAGLRTRGDHWEDGETTVIYPDVNPTAETLPTPAAEKTLKPGWQGVTPLRSLKERPEPGAAPVPTAPSVPEPLPGMPGDPQSGVWVPDGQPVTADSFLPPQEKPWYKSRPFDKLRTRLSKKPAEDVPPGFPAGYQQVQDVRLPDGAVIEMGPGQAASLAPSPEADSRMLAPAGRYAPGGLPAGVQPAPGQLPPVDPNPLRVPEAPAQSGPPPQGPYVRPAEYQYAPPQ